MLKAFKIKQIKQKINLIFMLCFGLVSLQSCVAVVSSGVVVSAYAVARDKKASQTYSDLKIFLAAKNKILSSDYSSTALSVDLKVHNGSVYIIGRVRDDNTRMFIIDEISKIEGVNKIFDEIIVDSKTSAMRGMFISIKDGYITAKTKIILALTPNIRSANYNIETLNGSVYVIGNAVNIIEAEKVSLVIAKGFGVKKVVNYSTIID